MTSKIKFNEIAESGCFKNGDIFLYKSCQHEFYLQMIRSPLKKKIEFKLTKILNTKRNTEQKQITSSSKEKKLLINSTKFNNIVTAVTDLNREVVENKKVTGWRKNLYLVRNNKKASVQNIATRLVELIENFDIGACEKDQKTIEFKCDVNGGDDDDAIDSMKVNVSFLKSSKNKFIDGDGKSPRKNSVEAPKINEKKRKISSLANKTPNKVISIDDDGGDDDGGDGNAIISSNNNNKASIDRELIQFESFKFANYFLEMLIESLEHSNKLLNMVMDVMIKKLKLLYNNKKTKLDRDILSTLSQPLTQLSKHFFFDTIIMNIKDENFKISKVIPSPINDNFDKLLQNGETLINNQSIELGFFFENIEKCLLLMTNVDNKLILEKLINNLSEYYNDKLCYNLDGLDMLIKESFMIINLIISNEMKHLSLTILKTTKDNENKNANKKDVFSHVVENYMGNLTAIEKDYMLENFENGNINMEDFALLTPTKGMEKKIGNHKILDKIELYLETIKNIETSNDEKINNIKLECDLEHELVIKKIKLEHEKEKQELIDFYNNKERENLEKAESEKLIIEDNEKFQNIKKELENKESIISGMKDSHENEKQELLLKIAKFCDLNEDFKEENRKLIEEKTFYMNKINSTKDDKKSIFLKIQNLANEISNIYCIDNTENLKQTPTAEYNNFDEMDAFTSFDN